MRGRDVTHGEGLVLVGGEVVGALQAAVHVEAHVEAALATGIADTLRVCGPVVARVRHEGGRAVDAFYPVLV